jgi:hypothetical protein
MNDFTDEKVFVKIVDGEDRPWKLAMEIGHGEDWGTKYRGFIDDGEAVEV